MPAIQQKRYQQSHAGTGYTAAPVTRICSAEQWADYLAVTAVDKSHYQIKRILFDTTGVLGFNAPVKYQGANGAI